MNHSRDDRASAAVPPAPSFALARSQKRSLIEELRTGWEEGTPAQPEALLARWPTDPSADPDVASLLFEDFLQRRRQGKETSLTEYELRFPQQKDSLAQMVSRQEFLRSVDGTSGSAQRTLGLPEVDDELFGFRLRQELGRGAFARVFLAEQVDLAGRPVVLKISAIEGSEPQTLAQLQHTHIVPIYSVHEDERAGVRAVCMPYFGGASLSQVLHLLQPETTPPQQGGQLVAALEQAQAARPAGHALSAQTDSQTPLQILRSLSYVRAAAWIVARLAEALQHAHDRGVLHRDIKPSNILLSGDGQPLLLDFNLAQDQQEDPAQATLGGTIAYMAPEHLRAVAGRTVSLARQVDQRSDLYSLGMVLYEVLAGHSPFEQSASYSVVPVLIEAMAVERSQAAPSLRRQRSDIPWSLESIVRKCLAPEPAQRYQQAQQLAEDLRRFLEDQPLKYAPELSRVERLRKWIRRHPRLTSSGSVASAAAVLLCTVSLALGGVREHLVRTQEQLALTQARDRQQAYEKGTERALCLVNTTLEAQDHLRQGVAVCEETLALG